MKNYKFLLELEVRDYECDIQGIVNNAVYLNYLEHSRHKFLNKLGLNFSSFVKNKINFVVIKIEIDYKFPLKSGDKFFVGLSCEKISPLRLKFLQDIFCIQNAKPKMFVNAKIIVTAMDENGKLLKKNNIFDEI
ncbi:MAG: acyl-CoA thioesterase [Elusimicrobiota bacterium]|jgi:acyl-CoA thioester hydrolase|nr:acyl-CoA thioesterase [Elusimicrobiota bacterium]